jgi:hypothetical protein
MIIDWRIHIEQRRGIMRGRGDGWALVALGVAASLAILGATAYIANRLYVAYSLPLLIIGGVVAFLLVIGVLVLIYRRLGLTDRRFALGLPEGSIRAVIALTLILVFFVIALYMYISVANPAAGAAAPSQDAVKFGQQILTTLSTLVVAIASFYFGATSVAQAAGVTGTRDNGTPSIRVTAPSSFPATFTGTNPTTITLATTPADEPVTWEIEGDPGGEVVQIDPNTYEYRPHQPASAGVVVHCRLLNHPDVTIPMPFRQR